MLMKKFLFFFAALTLSVGLFAQAGETELFVAANASVDHTWGQFENPECTWNATTGTFTVTIMQQAEWQWGNQVFLATGITTLDVTKEYQVSFDIVASTVNCGGVTFKAFDDNQIAFANQNIAVTNVVQTWTSEWTKPSDEATNGLIVWDFGEDPAQTVTITNISIKERDAQAPAPYLFVDGIVTINELKESETIYFQYFNYVNGERVNGIGGDTNRNKSFKPYTTEGYCEINYTNKDDVKRNFIVNPKIENAVDSIYQGETYLFADTLLTTAGTYQRTIESNTMTLTLKVKQKPAPELTAPQVPTVDAANVKAIMCETYSNDLGYWPQGWGGCNWVDTCKAGVNIKYAKTMAWDCFASDWESAGVAGYANLHFDIWFAEDGNAPVVKLEFNGTDPTAKITIPGEYKAGWNSVNVNVEETFGEQPMNDLKCLLVEVTKEGGPVAWANILFYNGTYTSIEATGTCGETPVWPEDAPTTAPAAPTVDGASILGAALTTSYAFEPLDWPGAMPQLLTFETGETIYYMERMTWQLYTNWAADFYDVSKYNMLHVDLYPATGTEIKVTFEGLRVEDGGQGYKNSVVKTLTAGQWNALDIALSEFPALTSGDPYDFSDIRYFILENYNAEQTALTVGNVYFYSNPTALPTLFDDGVKVNKFLHNGQLFIRKNGKTYNAVGVEIR